MAPNKKNKTILSENIRLLRLSLKMTQEQFSNLTGVSQANVSQWETGAAIPPIKIIKIIKERYPKVNVESFFTKPEPNKNFQEDSQDLQVKSLTEENEVLRKQINVSEKEVRELRKEIERLRDQIEVMTLLVRQKVLKQ